MYDLNRWENSPLMVNPGLSGRRRVYAYKAMAAMRRGLAFDNRRIDFSVVEKQTRENHGNNEKGLWVDGELTPLPAGRKYRYIISGGPGKKYTCGCKRI
jgi:hypothetical protein